MKRTNWKSRGIAAVEFALILPAVLLLIMGTIEFGNMCYTWLTIQKAAQMGTRFATTGQGDDDGTRLSQIIAQTNIMLAKLHGGGSSIEVRSWPTISVSGSGNLNNPGQPCGVVEVSVAFQYEPIAPLVREFLPSTITLTGSDRKVNEPWKPCS